MTATTRPEKSATRPEKSATRPEKSVTQTRPLSPNSEKMSPDSEKSATRTQPLTPSPTPSPRRRSPTKLIKRMVKAFYQQYISNHHEFILCKHERKTAQALDKFISTIRLVYFSRPQGINAKYWCQGTIRPSDSALEVVNALVKFVGSVIVAGYTFNGKLSTGNLYWLATSKKVKVWGLTIGDMVKRTDQGVRADFSSLHDIITTKVFHKFVPKELRHLLQLMKSDPLRYFNLIVHNIVLLDDESKIAKYIIQHQKLVLAKQIDEDIYRRALTYIRCGECKDLKNWQNAVLYHPMLMKVLDHKNNKSLTTDSEGASIFGRHCCHHLLKYAVEDVSDKTKQNGSVHGEEDRNHHLMTCAIQAVSSKTLWAEDVKMNGSVNKSMSLDRNMVVKAVSDKSHGVGSVHEEQDSSRHLLKYATQGVSNKTHGNGVNNNINGSANKSVALDRNTGLQDLDVKSDKDQKLDLNKKRVIKLSLSDIFPLLECFVPGLFSEVQLAVFEIVEHHFPQELLKLRNKSTGGA